MRADATRAVATMQPVGLGLLARVRRSPNLLLSVFVVVLILSLAACESSTPANPTAAANDTAAADDAARSNAADDDDDDEDDYDDEDDVGPSEDDDDDEDDVGPSEDEDDELVSGEGDAGHTADERTSAGGSGRSETVPAVLPRELPTIHGPPLAAGASTASVFAIDDFETIIFVTPDGDDAADGSQANPLRTFAGARNMVRSLLDGSGHIAVYFRDGEYVFDETAVLGPADGGTPDQVITYAAFPGERPRFSSLRVLDDWETYQGNIFRAPLPEGLQHVRFLWDAQRGWLPRSATDVFLATELSPVEDACLECNWNLPDAQPLRLNVAYPEGFDTPDWSKANQYDLRESTHAWLQEILPIARVDEADSRIYTEIPASLEMRLNFEEPEHLNRNWVLNSIEGIDEPGEWASLDGWIYLYPQGDVADIRVPSLVELIRVDNEAADGNQSSEPVEYIHFDGLTFGGGDFYVMSETDVTIQHDWSVVDAPTALLRFRNVANIEVRNSTFEKSGSTGVRFDRYAQNNRVLSNTFGNLGREAIVFIGRGPGYGDVNHTNEIAFNSIHRTGMEKQTAPALVLDQSTNNHVHHNQITDTQFTAIVLTAPRQIMFAGLYEDIPGYLGREFHYFDVAPELLDELKTQADELVGSYWAMQHVYNYNNVVELNTLVDVGQGAGYLVNGYVYNSAVTRGHANFINYNYVHDTGNNQVNNAVFYSDSDQDLTTYVGNMISGVQNNDEQPESMPILLLFAMYAEGEFNEGTRIQAVGNVVIDSTYPELIAGINFDLLGTVTVRGDGDNSYASIYLEMASILESGELPGAASLPGIESMTEAVRSAVNGSG